MSRVMKESRIEWIGQIPQDWQVVAIKQLFSINRGRVIAKSEVTEEGLYPIYSSQTKNDGCMGYIDTYDYEGQKLTWTTDGANAGTVFIRDGKYNCTNVCGILSPNVNNNNCLRYLKYALEFIAIYHKRYDINGFKIMSNEMAEIIVTLPPIETQLQLANFLDNKCEKIDRLIALQEEMIEELKAYKQSVITEAVTKGLDPNVPMKDSGIEWIGEYPNTWSTNRIKYLCKFNHAVSYAQYDIISYAPMECVGRGILEQREINTKTISSGLTSFSNGDIIMAKVTPCFENGNIAIASNLLNGVGVGSSELFVFTPTKANTKWLFYFLQNIMFKELAKASMTGTGGLKRVSPLFVYSLSLALPKTEDQEKISYYLDKKCAEIDNLISIKRSKIDELKDYKKSLIYEYITGKKEVV